MHEMDEIGANSIALGDEEDIEPTSLGKRLRSRHSRIFSNHTAIIVMRDIYCVVIVMLLVGSLLTQVSSLWTKSMTPLEHCGQTTAQALAKGCSFDPMTFAWIPPECYDAELTEEFLQLQPWHWYTDEGGQQPIEIARVLRGEH